MSKAHHPKSHNFQLLPAGSAELASKHKVNRAHQAKACPQVIQLQWFLEVHHRERHENTQGDDFLNDFQLADTQHSKANAVGRNLQQVFEQRDAPTDECGNYPGLCSRLLSNGK